MLHLSEISLQGALKNAQNCKEKDVFYADLIIHLTVQSRGAPEGVFDGAPKDACSNLHKDSQEGACEVALLSALEAALELPMGLNLLMQ